jgi:hypothetical protein
MDGADLRAREAIVREHLASENAHDFDATIATFGHPRYELVATGDVYDGEEAVGGYFAETRRAFPDQRNQLIALHHADDAVIVERQALSGCAHCCNERTPAAIALGGGRGCGHWDELGAVISETWTEIPGISDCAPLPPECVHTRYDSSIAAGRLGRAACPDSRPTPRVGRV